VRQDSSSSIFSSCVGAGIREPTCGGAARNTLAKEAEDIGLPHLPLRCTAVVALA